MSDGTAVNKSTDIFENLGQVATQLSMEDIIKEVQERVRTQPRPITVDTRVADALEDINHTLEHLVKLLKPWAEREKRKNMLEQDPDYLEQVIKQVQQDRKARKPKGKKRK